MSASNSTPPASRWVDLPSDLLHDVSTRLSNVTDFVRFHAICRPWRDLQLHDPAARPAFPPWLLGSSNGLILHSVVNFGATSSHRRRDCHDIILPSPPGAQSPRDRNWVASADCTAAQLFTWSPEPSLIDLVTGAVIRLPLFPCDNEKRRLMQNPHGIIYNDGTIFLYSFIPEEVGGCIHSPIFTAAILRPGDATWTSGTKRIDVPKSRYLSVAYHDGVVVLLMGMNFWYAMTVHDLGGEKVMPMWKTFRPYREYILDGNYVFESCGQLMWASILVKRQPPSGGDYPPPPSAISVTVEVLEETKEGGEMGWVTRHGRSLGDRVLFLGSPASFAVDVVQLGVPGGCAYFVCRTGVFRYNFVNDEAQLLEQLRPGWGANRFQLTIAPIQEIQERLQA